MIPDFARDILAGRDIVMLSDGKPKRTFCYATDAITGYYKVLVRGRAGEPYNIGIDRPEISMAELAEPHRQGGRAMSAATAARSCWASSSEADYLVDNPNRRCPVIDKARDRARLRSEGLDRGRHLPVADLVQPQPDRGGGLMKVSIVGTGYVGLVTGACLAERGHDVVCVDVDPRKVDMINCGARADPRGGPARAAAAQRRAGGCARRRIWPPPSPPRT